MGAPNLVPDNMDNCLSYAVISTLKKLKNQVGKSIPFIIAITEIIIMTYSNDMIDIVCIGGSK